METAVVQKFMWLVTGVVLSVVVGVMFQAWRAEAVGSDETTFVPTTPCRLIDTRPGTSVGLRVKPIGASETYRLQVTGANGQCVVPDDATGVAMNVTSANASSPSFLQLWPADEDRPERGSSLNYLPGQAPTPNKVDVKLSADGKVAVFNRFGTVDVIADVVGYYTSSGLTDLDARLAGLESDMETLRTDNASTFARLATLESDNASLRLDIAALEADVAALESLTASMTVETVDGQPTVRFSGVNVQVVNGLGSSLEDPNAVGNLILGYNENIDDVARTGSHNLVIGIGHSYDGTAGLVVGRVNAISQDGAVAFGDRNVVTGHYASVLGGSDNVAVGNWSTVSGGYDNTAAQFLVSITGGDGVTCDTDFLQSITCGEGALDAPD